MTEMCDQSACLMPHSPFFSHLLTVETIPELNDPSTPLSQDARILHVVPHQVPHGHELFTTTQVIVVTCFPDSDVNYLINMPVSVRGEARGGDHETFTTS